MLMFLLAACGKDENKQAETATTSVFPALSSSRNNMNSNNGTFTNLSSVVVQPTDPQTPIDPTAPSNPTNPTTPTDPTTPTNPTTPTTPQDPSAPQTPTDPTTPTNPTTPTTPTTPQDPSTPQTPTDPTTPQTPDTGTTQPPVVDAPLHSVSVKFLSDSETEINFTFALINGYIQELSKSTIQDGNVVGVPAILKVSDVARVIWNGDIAGWDSSPAARYQAPLVVPTTTIKGPVHDIGIIRLVANDGSIYTINARNTIFMGTGLYMDSRTLIGY